MKHLLLMKRSLFVKDIIIQGEPFKVDNFRVIPFEYVMFYQSSKDKIDSK